MDFDEVINARYSVRGYLDKEVEKEKLDYVLKAATLAPTGVNYQPFKVYVIDTKKNCLVGCHMIGSYTSEMIYGAALMIEKQMPIEQIKELVFPHPTVCEVIREALFM